MLRSVIRNRNLLLLIAVLLLLVVTIGLIWWHYDRELRQIEERVNKNDLNVHLRDQPQKTP
jgi:type II secretory pathway component PulM